jgi:hypothetical protein
LPSWRVDKMPGGYVVRDGNGQTIDDAGTLRRTCFNWPPWISSAPRIQRRRALAASLHIPPELSAKFTEGEMAVLKVVADRHVRYSACTLTRDTIADLSGTGRGTVKTALRTAKAEGLIEVRQGSRCNTIIVSTQW